MEILFHYIYTLRYFTTQPTRINLTPYSVNRYGPIHSLFQSPLQEYHLK